MQQDQIIAFINQMDADQLVQLNNEYCQQISDIDNEIFINDDEFYNVYFKDNPIRLAQAIFYGDYNFSHEYIIFNGYGNLETFNYITIDKLSECIETIAQYIQENFNDFEYLFY